MKNKMSDNEYIICELAKLIRYDLAGDYDPYIVPLSHGDYIKYEDVRDLLERINES